VLTSLIAAAGCAEHTIQAYPDELAGIGVVLKSEPVGFVVGSVVDGGPAVEAGIKVGDRLLEVDGKSIEGKTLATVVDSLRGVDGSQVMVRVASAGDSEVMTLKRRVLRKGSVGYQARH